jgi:hypothetical protein
MKLSMTDLTEEVLAKAVDFENKKGHEGRDFGSWSLLRTAQESKMHEMKYPTPVQVVLNLGYWVKFIQDILANMEYIIQRQNDRK